MKLDMLCCIQNHHIILLMNIIMLARLNLNVRLMFLITDLAVDHLKLDGFSLEQSASSYYVPVEIIKLKFNNL